MRQFATKLLGPAQFDELRVAARVLRGADGVMIDVGAHHGGALAEFALRGWQIHAFEPDPENRRVLLDGPGQLPHVHIDPRAVTETSGQEVDFFTSGVSTGISSLTAFHPSHVRRERVVTIALRDYLAEAGVEGIDLLKTDCEGHDLFALRSLDWGTYRPTMVLCEFEDRKTARLGYTHRDLVQLLDDAGYVVLVSEWAPIVEYGRRHTWRRIARWPTTVDEDGWGNLIAVSTADARRTVRVARAVAAQYRLRQLVDRRRS